MTFHDISGSHPLYIAAINRVTEDMRKWMEGSFTKVVVGVNSEEEIYELAEAATRLDILHAVIVDSGFTEFHGNKTTTCIAIGPDKSEKIDKITKELPLI
jgi:PTH2 family peptidyl-tRNA hydrolase